MKNKYDLNKNNLKKKYLVALITLAFSNAEAAQLTLSTVPLFLTTNTKPNVMVLYGNSNSMDTDATGAAVGSANPTGKSEISRNAVKNLINAYNGKLNLGLMAYQQSNIVINDLYNSGYDVSYDSTAYNPLFTGDRASTTKKFRMANPSSPGNFIYYNVALPAYFPFNSNATARSFHCLTTDARSHPFTNGETIANNNVNDPLSGPWLSYACYQRKIGENNAGPTNINAVANGYSVGWFNGPFSPTDSDLAQGITNFGNQLAGVYVSPTWFSNTSPGNGYVHVPIAELNDTQVTKLNKKLATSQFVTNAPTNSERPLQNAGLTPLAGSVNTAKNYFSGALTANNQGGPLTAPPNSCSKNFLVMLTDGLPSVLANGQISYNTTTLLTDLKTSVSSLKNSTQNVRTYVVGFALPYGVNPSQLNQIADVGGTTLPYYANDPDTLNTALGNVFNDIINKSSASSSVALNSGYISASNKVFQATFDSTNWSGDVLSIPLRADGSLPLDPSGAAVWKAATVLNSIDYDDRVIITRKASTGVGVPFRWSDADTINSLDDAQKTYLNTSPTTTLIDDLGSSRLNYLRGDRSLEGTTFRSRDSKLGDIIDSSPVLVAAPSGSMIESSYLNFKQSHKDRIPVIYVGANDGMLHAFNRNNGREILAYVPNAVFSQLNQLSSPAYSHRYYVNATPAVSDVYYDSQWHSVLVGSMGLGFKGIYSLDVTNPSAFTEANAANIAKFEYTQANDADVGYISGTPSLIKLNNGKWAALFGNGYNNNGSGKAALFMVDLETGALIKKVVTSVGTTDTPNGLSNPSAVDVDGNGTVDYVYAGDLTGRVWKFDLSSSNKDNWVVAFSGQPLFNTGQPITTQPEVTIHPSGGYMVLVGTGKYIETADNNTIASNAFYGLYDNGNTVISDISSLQAQTIASTTTISGTSYRKTSANTVNYATKRGWYLTLSSTGERVITNSVLRGSKIIFTTMTPSTNTCSYGGTSWLMQLDYLSGVQPTSQIFDTNKDGQITSVDTKVSGIALSGISSEPTILQGLGTAYSPLNQLFLNQSTGEAANILTTGSGLTSRRTSWREVIKKE